MEKVIVTIARQYGSGGKTIGTMLAEDLGIKAYSREILRLASEESGINEALFNKADERLKSTSLFGIMKREYKGELIPPESDDFTSNRNLFNYQAKVIKALAEEALRGLYLKRPPQCGQCVCACFTGILLRAGHCERCQRRKRRGAFHPEDGQIPCRILSVLYRPGLE